MGGGWGGTDGIDAEFKGTEVSGLKDASQQKGTMSSPAGSRGVSSASHRMCVFIPVQVYGVRFRQNTCTTQMCTQPREDDEGQLERDSYFPTRV